MIGKLLSLLATAKGAAAVAVIAVAGVTGVAVTNPDVQSAITTTLSNGRSTEAAHSERSASPKPSESAKPSDAGKPAVVEARNDADKKLRDAFGDDQKKLAQLHNTKVANSDRAKLEDTLKDADTKLRARLTKALDDVAALTLGREGHENEATAATKPSGSPSPRPSPDVKVALTAETQAKITTIVSAAILDMDKIVQDTLKTVAALPTAEPGKPSENPGNKPSENPGSKPSENPGKPAETAKPTTR